MKKGFYTIMSAQFFSSLADNALFVAAVELLRSSGEPEWQRAALVPMFALFYVLLAPFVGAFADAIPKGRVMFISNSIKVIGCLMMLVGSHPLLAYAIVGLGAAAYSPAKYGILTELLPPSQLVKANGWIEGLTISSIILGVLLGGQLVGHRVADVLLAFDLPLIDTGIDTPPEAAIASLVSLYVIAALFNLRIPRTDAVLQPMDAGFIGLVRDFMDCNSRLWQDKLGQISLATTTLFWGVSGNLRYIVLAWAAAALGYGTTQASSLVGVVAIGTAVGAVVASVYMRLDKATGVIPLGIAMEQSGTAALLAQGLSHLIAGWPPLAILLVMFSLAALLTQVMSDAATTALLGPISIATAQVLDLPPEPFVVCTALGAVVAFLTPIGHHGNLLILRPGQYRFGDFLRVGLPLTVLAALVSAWMARWLWMGGPLLPSFG